MSAQRIEEAPSLPSLSSGPSRCQQGLRLLFLLTLTWGASTFWIAQHPPMVDLPQHAGQVGLLRDLLLQRSPWSSLIEINLMTPYLIGYALAIPLSLVMPVGVALKLLLSLAYLGFVALCMRVRRQLGGDARLDWLFLLGCTGFAVGWGFFTFLLASPLVLALVWMADRHGRHPAPKPAWAVFGLGITLLAAHGLAFALGWTVTLALVLIHHWRARRPWRSLPSALAPMLALALTCLLFYAVTHRLQVNAELSAMAAEGLGIDWEQRWLRLPKAVLILTVGSYSTIPLAVAALLLLAAPLLLGLKLAVRTPWQLVPLVVVLGFLSFAPASALTTGFIYHRFALFLMPAWAWAFACPEAATGKRPSASRSMLATFAMMLACWTVLGQLTLQHWRFDREEADFRTVLAAAQPGHRALGIVLDSSSQAMNSPVTYMHQPLWYQAERSGFVDFNFAWFAPEIARFKPGQEPAIREQFSWHPDTFDWVRDGGSRYRYFFVRGTSRPASEMFQGAECAPTLRAASGSWTLYEQQRCP